MVNELSRDCMLGRFHTCASGAMMHNIVMLSQEAESGTICEIGVSSLAGSVKKQVFPVTSC